MSILVSVIMPAYNAEAWIQKAIEGMQAQTYENWELIIVNDGSQDRTAEICQAAAKKDSRLCLITQENTGPSGARNRGIQCVTGEYFTFIDCDDELRADALERYVQAAQKYGADTVVVGYRMENTLTGNRTIFSCDREYAFTVDNDINISSVEELVDQNLMASNWNKLYRNTLLRHCFNEELSINEDVLYSLDALHLSHKVAVLPEALYIYRIQNSDSVSMKFHPEFPVALDAMEKVILLGSSDALRPGLARWLMNYMYIYLKSVCCNTKLDRNEKVSHIKAAVSSNVFRAYGTVKRADTQKRKLAAALLRAGCYSLYLRLLSAHIRSN